MLTAARACLGTDFSAIGARAVLRAAEVGGALLVPSFGGVRCGGVVSFWVCDTGGEKGGGVRQST